MNINISKSYGYVLIVGVLLYLTQQLLMVIPVALERKNTNIKAPTLYPRDSEIEKLKLTKTNDEFFSSMKNGNGKK